MKILKVIWQQDIDEDLFQERLNFTYINLRKAILALSSTLKSLGIKIVLEKEIAQKEITRKTSWDRRILIDGEPIEKILDLEAKKDNCFGICGKVCKASCSESMEEIPEHLISTAILHKVRDKLRK